ncbi:MAG: hypothetical protein AAF346_08340 [Pseudomonadota bacterium]
MNTAKFRDVWLLALVAILLAGFGLTQATAERNSIQSSSYTFAVSTGPELQLVSMRAEIPKHGKTLVCENLITIATARIGHNCQPTISGIASTSLQ